MRLLIKLFTIGGSVVSNRSFHPMESSVKSMYEEAVCALNSLQSNAAVLQKAREERSVNAHLNITGTQKHLLTLGITVEDLNALNIIHVAGTKGKGSTCAFAESILRAHGHKTGFYSSPHLISVNERIRINGQPIAKDVFAEYFWKVYKSIQGSLKNNENMPPYFMFLTVMAFYVFVKENVEAAVIEVGIGGLWDCTNVISKPVVVGISTLGIDHVNILGETISEIAAQKAGILKPNVPAFTVSQPEKAMKVLREKAQEIGCRLLLSPPVNAFEKEMSLGLLGNIQNVNASLALQLTHEWLKIHQGKDYLSLKMDKQNSPVIDCYFTSPVSPHIPLSVAPVFPITLKTVDALENCRWPGRFQVVKKGKITFFLDGAHTQQSIKLCARWFMDERSKMTSRQPVLKVLYFNCTGERKAECLLDPLADVHFDLVIFSPNRVHVVKDASSDLSNFMVDPEKEMQQCAGNREMWRHLVGGLVEDSLSVSATNSSVPMPALQAYDNSLLFPSVSEALDFLSAPESFPSNNDKRNCAANANLFKLFKGADRVHVLVTGSLHLVGGVLSLLDA